MTKVEYLGVIILEGKVVMDPIKAKGAKNWNHPQNLHNVRSFIGFLNFYRQYIRGFSNLARPLNHLIAHIAKENKFYWNNEEEQSFRALIKAVTTALVLKQPNFEEQFIVDIDALQYMIGAVLQQKDLKGELYLIAYLSKTLDQQQ